MFYFERLHFMDRTIAEIDPQEELPVSEQEAGEGSACILVLGMHRSGTSALTRVLSLLGAALPNTLVGPGPGNESGHWEPARLVEYHNRLLQELRSGWHDWQRVDLSRLSIRRRNEVKAEIAEIISAEYGDARPIVVKDPRICRFAGLFLDALDEAGLRTLPVVLLRNPLEVAESLERREEFWSAELTRSDALLLWLRHALDAEFATRARSRVILSYDCLLADWKGALAKIGGRLDVSWPYEPDEVAAEVERFLTPRLRHHARTSDEVVTERLTRSWVSEAYAALRVLEQNNASRAALRSLDRIRREFDHAAPLLRAMSEEFRQTYAALRASAQAQREEATSEIDRVRQKLRASEAAEFELAARLEALQTEKDEAVASLARTAEAAVDPRPADRSTGDSDRVDEERAREHAHLTAALAERESMLRSLERRLAQSETHRQALLHSTSWRITAPIRALKNGSIEAVRTGRTVGRAISFGGGIRRTIGKAARVYREEGVAGLKWRYRYAAEIRPGAASGRKPEQAASRSADANGRIVEIAPLPATEPQRDVAKAELVGPFAEAKRAVLDSQRPLLARIEAWTKARAVEGTLSVEELLGRLRDALPADTQRIVISITHDDYRQVIGGVQLCVQLEQGSFERDGAAYLALHPAQPLPILSRETDAAKFSFHAIGNGKSLGIATAATVADALDELMRLRPAPRVSCVIHSMLGHSPEVVGELCRRLHVDRALFWIHDFFSLCPNHVLLRNDVSFCAAPPVQSSSCAICLYGAERVAHLGRLGKLFDVLAIDVVAPSRAALEFWQVSTQLRHHRADVLGHSELVSPRTLPPQNERRPIRIAFLGHPVLHKGWPVFLQLAKLFSGDRRYAFHHLGDNNTNSEGIAFARVRTNGANRQAMTAALIEHDIDIALLWADCFETFSFTFHEAVAAGVLVLTHPGSGNVHAAISSGMPGMVVSDARELLAVFQSNKLVEAVGKRRQSGRVVYEAEISPLSKAFVS